MAWQDYDEEFLLQELQRLLTANNQLLQYKAQLESENKMLQQEGDLLSQQLESASPASALSSLPSRRGFVYARLVQRSSCELRA